MKVMKGTNTRRLSGKVYVVNVVYTIAAWVVPLFPRGLTFTWTVPCFSIIIFLCILKNKGMPERNIHTMP